MPQKNKKNKINNVLITGGTGLTGIGLARRHYQAQMNPSLVDVTAAATWFSNARDKKETGSLAIQRDSLARELTDAGADVTVKTHFDNWGLGMDPIATIKGRLQKGSVVSSPIHPTTGIPAAAIHVSKPFTPFKTFYDRFVKGQPNYRMFSDYGYGPQLQNTLPIEDMRAVKTPMYTRNIVPGGDLVAPVKYPLSKFEHVSTIPVDKTFHFVNNASKNIKPKVLLYPGGGVQWGRVLKNPAPIVDATIQMFDDKFGRGNYEFYHQTIPAELEAHIKKMYYPATKLPFMSREQFAKELAAFDYIIGTPGSTIAEIAAIEGRKPKFIALTQKKDLKGGGYQGQFHSNPEWYKKKLGGGMAIADITDGLGQIPEAFDTLNSNPEASHKAVRFTSEDSKKILSLIKTDLATAKKYSKGMLIGGLGLTAAGIIKKIKDNKK